MKNVKIYKLTLLLFIFLVGGVQTTEAQFWKKLGKKAEEAAKETINRKTQEKVAQKTEQVLDSLFDVDKKVKGKKRKNKANKKPSYKNDSLDVEGLEDMLEDYLGQEDIDLPESYSFEWKYVIKMESEAYKKQQKEMGGMEITYLLSNESTAFATKFDMGNRGVGMSNTLMVMDPSAGINFTLMEIEGEKIIQNMPSMGNIPNENDNSEEFLDNMTIKKIGTKEILGYTCQGFEIQIDEGTSRVYINPNAPVSFNNSGDPKFAPKGFSKEWLTEFKNGLMMEMSFTSSKNPKHNMKMSCVELVKESLTVNISEYKSFMEMGEEE